MNRKEIREEIVALGAQAIANGPNGEARLNRWIQQAIREICDFKPWPFLYATKEGAAPLAIADLGHVIGVVDVDRRNSLDPATLNELLEANPRLDAVGGAEVWYIDDGTKIKVYPSSSSTFKVHYRKVPVELEDEEVPIVPEDYHELIVTRVMVKVYKATDNFAAAAEVIKDYERERNGMVHALMKPNYDKERRMRRTGNAGDYQ